MGCSHLDEWFYASSHDCATDTDGRDHGQVEHAYNDGFCIAQLAAIPGREADSRKHERRGPIGTSRGKRSSASRSATAWATWPGAGQRAGMPRTNPQPRTANGRAGSRR